MKTLHILNAFFEKELESTHPAPQLYDAFHAHPLFLQFQFLPFLYAQQGDGIVLSDPPPTSFLEFAKFKGIDCHPLSDPFEKQYDQIDVWGHSPLIAAWAKKHHLNYQCPDWETVKNIHSKQFAFLHTPQLPHAQLVHNESEAKAWLHSFSGEKVFKTCFGLSATGHFLCEESQISKRLSAFLQKEFRKNLPVIAEPWVQRILDFSTQWEISIAGGVKYLGATVCKNGAKGQYICNSAGKEESLLGTYLPFLFLHHHIARPLLAQIAALGFFGNIGIDAMVYFSSDGEPVLHPVVEINARKTMGWIAHRLQQIHTTSDSKVGIWPSRRERVESDEAAPVLTQGRCRQISKSGMPAQPKPTFESRGVCFPREILTLEYTKTDRGTLPQALLLQNGKTVSFAKNFIVYNS